ncbi:DarT ssDNA thymidine ADP-ribosyltransferase family protein [Spirulina sp. CS-785/01]|uniref:DarT ssDNA thymidine ADP-ribosyltransferase family protein n=1 Tax=Spirulina sp. CS-785/01 TaxID=3021716 RepID=UPI00232C87B3|nr:DarT ssDNA thymidine ADP-ribosyltransferase family protein [Spirulina sp. CS-785/01]MDB9315948.1 DarT ssDNA thymidine ADP-ribosyltransferase family protein [Spirulina sp. CS-785/01]
MNIIHNEVKKRGITRLCHFTPSRNLVHILTGETGILATQKLQEDERNVFTQTDLERLDQHEGYICCSIEYPNAWYFDCARAKDTIFRDWVVLFINSSYLWEQGTRFCPRNAASRYGRNIIAGEQGFLSLFANSVLGKSGKTRTRNFRHLACCPTDDQAEVLIPDQIASRDIVAIAVPTETQAKNEAARLELLGVNPDQLNFVIAPTLFKKRELSQFIRKGQRPQETPWKANEV